MTRRSRLLLDTSAALVIVSAAFLTMAPRSGLLGLVPYLLLFACPLLHLFGHGHGAHRSPEPPSRSDPPVSARTNGERSRTDRSHSPSTGASPCKPIE